VVEGFSEGICRRIFEDFDWFGNRGVFGGFNRRVKVDVFGEAVIGD